LLERKKKRATKFRSVECNGLLKIAPLNKGLSFESRGANSAFLFENSFVERCLLIEMRSRKAHRPLKETGWPNCRVGTLQLIYLNSVKLTGLN